MQEMKKQGTLPHFLIAFFLFLCSASALKTHVSQYEHLCRGTRQHPSPSPHTCCTPYVQARAAPITWPAPAARRPTSGPTLSATTSPPCPRRPVSSLISLSLCGLLSVPWLSSVASCPHSARFLCSAFCRPDRRCERLRGAERHDEQRHGHEEHHGKSGTLEQAVRSSRLTGCVLELLHNFGAVFQRAVVLPHWYC
jgi:hypothetical protein